MIAATSWRKGKSALRPLNEMTFAFMAASQAQNLVIFSSRSPDSTSNTANLTVVLCVYAAASLVLTAPVGLEFAARSLPAHLGMLLHPPYSGELHVPRKEAGGILVPQRLRLRSYCSGVLAVRVTGFYCG